MISMNYVSHHEVARQFDPAASPDFLFGSCVTDFARMAGARGAFQDFDNPDLQEGIRFHKLTNKPAFDDQPEMKELETGMKVALATFLPLRTAHQASRVAKDLLFDGVQLAQPEVMEAFHGTLNTVLAGDVELPKTGIADLFAIIRDIHEHGPPRYDDPAVVSDRLLIVLDKTRTPIDEADQPKVTEVLETFQPLILDAGPLAMSQTVEWLRENFVAQNSSLKPSNSS